MPKVTIPIPIIDEYIISSNVVESTEAIYSAGTAYSLGSVVRTEGVNEHRLWRSVHGITAEYPLGNKGYSPLAELNIDKPVHWSFISSTNKYNLFDTIQSTQTKSLGVLQYTLGNGLPRFNLVSVLNISNAISVNLTVLNASNIEIFNETRDMVSIAGINNMWRWLFWPRNTKKSIVFTDLTPLTNSKVIITINGATPDSEVGAGLFVIGNGINFDEQAGITTVDYGATTSVRDFSIRQEDEYTGDYRFKRGLNTVDGKFTFFIQKSLYDLWNETLKNIGANPVLFTATNEYDSTNIFGIFGKSDASIDYPTHCRITTEIRGLV
jgi:hypothetical protein